jgi:hypothetical protein
MKLVVNWQLKPGGAMNHEVTHGLRLISCC